MREATARAGWLHSGPNESLEPEALPQSPTAPAIGVVQAWSPERFAQEQIRRLVRQVFLSSGPMPVRQVVFGAVDLRTDVETICTRVGETLAGEAMSDIAVVGGAAGSVRRSGFERTGSHGNPDRDGDVNSENAGFKEPRNLWYLPAKEGLGWGSKASMKAYLNDIRREFQYSIVQGPPAADSEEAVSLAEFADGMILVVSAQRTRRVAALRIREMLADAQVRLLGTVLSDREFPIPEKIYRRL